jgi:integrase
VARPINRLTDAMARAASKKGRHADGRGLYLNVSKTGSKSWVFVWRDHGRHREMGLGPYPTIGLALARRKADEARLARLDGRDPIAEKRKARSVSFADTVKAFLASKSAAWSNEKHSAQWAMTLGEAYCSKLLPMPVRDISTDDVLRVLKPIWQTKAETASRLRGRIERVLDFATVQGWRDGENPARWRGHLDAILPAPKKLARGHHAAMPYQDVPAFVHRLRALDAISASALEFGILTAARSGELLGAKWSEVDLEARTWAVPAERMKARREHVVPLSVAAMAILERFRDARTVEHIFPGHKHGAGLSNGAFPALFKRMKVEGVTAHGFRSAFRDWAGDETSFSREVCEAALAHRVGDASEQAYRRGSALEKRRALMEAWASYCGGEGKVVRLVDAGTGA